MLEGGSTATPHDHAVNFYDDDLELVNEVAAFVATGLARGERTIVVATAAHRALFDQALLVAGCDPVGARRERRLLTFDASDLLGSFLVAGRPEPARFAASVGALVEQASADGSRVRIFGEMVAVLWDEGNVTAALELESLWNDLGAHREFSLFCAYGLTLLAGSDLEDVHRVCELHSVVVPPRAYASVSQHRSGTAVAASRSSQIFVCLPAAVPAVRRFVSDVLAEWGQHDLIPDAILVASELATNAVRHAGSPFRVSVDRSGAGMRIAVEDLDAAHPAVCVTAGEDSGGRGVVIVDGVCDSWGWDPMPRGKVVWGDLGIARGVDGGLSAAV